MVQTIQVESECYDSEWVESVVEALSSEDLVIYPTETVYGLAADATSDKPVAKVFRAKSRPLENPISVAVDSMSMAYRVAKLTDRAEDLIQKFLPGPLTILVESRPILSEILFGGTSKVGLRIPDNKVALKLIGAFDGPVTSTSANISGKPSPTTVDEAIDQIGGSVKYALDSGVAEIKTPTTVVDVSSGNAEIIRKGPISKSDVESLF